MFEGVGENRSQGKGRQAGAMIASLLFNGGIIGILIYFGNQVVEEVQEEIPVEVTFFNAAPPPPPPPPPPGIQLDGR